MKTVLISVEIRQEQDVVATRQRARQIAGQLGFGVQDQTGWATAVSEIARNAFRYAGGGRAEFAIDGDLGALVVAVKDRGRGITDLDRILAGQYVSSTGMGLGIVGSRRLTDVFDLRSEPGAGTTVVLGKYLPKRAGAVTPQVIAHISAELAQRPPQNPYEEVQQQNRELLQSMDALRARQAEIERLNAELAETNRGVLALYAELDERATSLRRASELKSTFLSDMSHELRTPLNAMISLSGLLLDRADGDLTGEQEKQVRFIRQSAQSLGEMVNDLLDLAKIESGKADLRLSHFRVGDVLAALRGMFRPLLVAERPVALVIDEPSGIDAVHSDEGKVAQVLRNFISNALKFTVRGEVRVTAAAAPGGKVVFSVADTGIGIAAPDQSRIFEEFTQVDGPLQRKARGTGLGLPLTRKLAGLLGGDVWVDSEQGVGSTFYFTMPTAGPGNQPSRPDEASAVTAEMGDPRSDHV